MMSRAEALALKKAQAKVPPAAPKEDDFPASWEESPSSPDRYPLEDDFSAMYLALKNAKGVALGSVRIVAGWSPEERHHVAMWIEGALQDAPAVIAKHVQVKVATNPEATIDEEREILGKAEVKIASDKASSDRTRVVAISAAGAEDSVTVVAGLEKFSPVQYNTVDVGPFTITLRVLPGETHAEAIARGRGILRAQFDEERKAKVQDFVRAYKGIQAAVSK